MCDYVSKVLGLVELQFISYTGDVKRIRETPTYLPLVGWWQAILQICITIRSWHGSRLFVSFCCWCA